MCINMPKLLKNLPSLHSNHPTTSLYLSQQQSEINVESRAKSSLESLTYENLITGDSDDENASKAQNKHLRGDFKQIYGVPQAS